MCLPRTVPLVVSAVQAEVTFRAYQKGGSDLWHPQDDPGCMDEMVRNGTCSVCTKQQALAYPHDLVVSGFSLGPLLVQKGVNTFSSGGC